VDLGRGKSFSYGIATESNKTAETLLIDWQKFFLLLSLKIKIGGKKFLFSLPKDRNITRKRPFTQHYNASDIDVMHSLGTKG